MECRTLGKTGLQVSLLGFGAATLGNEYGEANAAECARAVHFAIDSGINFFDVAPYYGRNLAEERLGEALQGRRHEVILATKCGRYDVAAFDFSAGRIRRSVDESLQRLRTDYLDILHAHDVEFTERSQIVNETIPALRDIQRQGKARFIGITGLPVRVLREIATSAPVDCVLSYARWNLLNRDLDPVLGDWALEHNIGLINASPLHLRLLTGQGPPEWHLASAPIREAALRVVEICRQHQVSVTEVALRFALGHPAVSSTLTGISSVEEVRRNLCALDRQTDPELLRRIESAVAPVIHRIWPSGLPANQDPEMAAGGAAAI